MAKSPSDSFFQTVENLGQCLQSHLSNFLQRIDSHRKSDPSLSFNQEKLSSSSSATVADDPINLPPLLVKQDQSAKPSTKEEVGRATWTLLHTIAAQLPERPTKQQKRDVKELFQWEWVVPSQSACTPPKPHVMSKPPEVLLEFFWPMYKMTLDNHLSCVKITREPLHCCYMERGSQEEHSDP
ncbi:hypothetical protein AMTR_s00155p00013140 [Amborella trichopoda]|uniref:Sulfhydryl oxidase n=1 Tax=Amborella trichopoda TaxID=13333 RepID=W1PCJ4_AMBTC|nr:hypothetical protein AMTR_s00155p00013140 [Amborella trichopoda]